MKLMTKAIATKLIKADIAVMETGGGADEVIVKYFTPWANATWYIASGTPLNENGEPDYEAGADAVDWHLFGYCDLGMGPGCSELGYVLLSEMAKLRGPAGLMVERDYGYEGYKLADVQEAA